MDLKDAVDIFLASKNDEESTPAKVEAICNAYAELGMFIKKGEYPDVQFGLSQMYRDHRNGNHGLGGDFHVNDEGHLEQQRLVPADCFMCADQWGFIERWLEDHS